MAEKKHHTRKSDMAEVLGGLSLFNDMWGVCLNLGSGGRRGPGKPASWAGALASVPAGGAVLARGRLAASDACDRAGARPGRCERGGNCRDARRDRTVIRYPN
jgi:hypothetical protein